MQAFVSIDPDWLSGDYSTQRHDRRRRVCVCDPEPGSVESVRKTGEVRSFNHEIIRINSLGNVVIEDDVEIGAGTCIDRGTLGETRINRGTKLDNLIQVGHNAMIGGNCLIVSQVGIGGSSKTW
jgi:UDP-3-O-[3-hydroxymyristoyl] glucosamine N-acyltransferase